MCSGGRFSAAASTMAPCPWSDGRGSPACDGGSGVELVFVALGLAALVYGLYLAWTWNAVRSWPSVEGVIVSARTEDQVVRRDGSHVTLERSIAPRVRYEYAVDGQRHSGRRVRIGDVALNTPAAAEKVVQRYPPRRRVPVYYAPHDPRRSVLERQPGPGIALNLVAGALFVAIGLALA